MEIAITILLLATLATGMMAGIFFTWSNAVTTGLGRLTDQEYLAAFQSMNRTILNPAFFAIIWSPVALLPLAWHLQEHSWALAKSSLFLSALIYLFGVMFVTLRATFPSTKWSKRQTWRSSQLSMQGL